jgi:hypothetical protein
MELINDLVYFSLIGLYGIQFFVDTKVFSYPAKTFDGKKELGLNFNKQKKLNFLVRMLVNFTYPLVAYLVDINYFHGLSIFALLLMMIASMIGVLFARPKFQKINNVKINHAIRAG